MYGLLKIMGFLVYKCSYKVVTIVYLTLYINYRIRFLKSVIISRYKED